MITLFDLPLLMSTLSSLVEHKSIVHIIKALNLKRHFFSIAKLQNIYNVYCSFVGVDDVIHYYFLSEEMLVHLTTMCFQHNM